MRLHARIPFASVLAIGGALLTLAVPTSRQARAATTPVLYFDPNGSAAGFGAAGTYSWDSTSSLVWTTASTGTATTTDYTDAQTAAATTATYEYFQTAGTITVTVSSDDMMTGLDDAVAQTVNINRVTGTSVGSLVLLATNGYGIGSTTAGSGNFQEFRIASGGGVVINAPISGAGGVRENGSGYLALYGSNSYTGGTLATGGQTIYYNNSNSFGMAVGGGASTLTITGGISAALGATSLTNNTLGDTLTTNIAFFAPTSASATFASISFVYNNVAYAGTVAAPGAVWSGTISLTSTLTAPGVTNSLLGGQYGNVTKLSGVISNVAAGTNSPLILNSASNPGTLILAGANAYTGLTTVNGGTVYLTSSNTTSGLAETNHAIVNLSGSLSGGSTPTLSLTGGILNFTGAAAQTFTSTAFLAGSSTVTDSGSMLLNLGAITRTGASAVVGFTEAAPGDITTSSTNGSNGILGGYATVNGTSFATVNTGAILGLTTTDASYGSDYTAAGSMTDFDATTSGTFTNTGVNSLRFNTAAATTATLNGAFLVSSGGILQSSNVGGNASTISGGTSLTSSNGTDLIVNNYDTTAGGTLTIATPIIGSIGLTITGTGTTILTGTNTYTGVTNIVGGALLVPSLSVLPSSTFPTLNGGLFGLSVTGTLTNAVAVGTLGSGLASAAGTTTTFSGILTANNGLSVGSSTATGTVVLTATNVINSGTPVFINGGTLQIGAGGTAGTLGSTTSQVFDNSVLAYNNSGAISVANAISGSGSVTQLGGGTLTVSGINSYSGGTNIAAGTVLAGSTTAFGGGPITDNAALQLGGKNISTSALSGTGTITDSNLTVATLTDAQTTTTTFSGAISNGATGTLSLTKSGTGTLILTGTNSYTGATTISGGTLVAGSASAVSAGTIAINSGGTLSAGTAAIMSSSGTAETGGTVASASLNTGGAIEPTSTAASDSGATTLKFSSSLTLNGGTFGTSTVGWMLGSDFVDATAATFNSSVASTTFNFSGDVPGTFNLIYFNTPGSGFSGGLTSANANSYFAPSGATGSFQVGTDTSGDSILQFIDTGSSSTPEPGSLALLAFGSVAGLPFVSRLRRRKS